jgi:hypothetical protein
VSREATPPVSPQPANSVHRTTKDLTAVQRCLLEIVRQNQFGRIENVPIRGGQPVVDRGATVVRVTRLGGQSEQTKLPDNNEFELKQAFVDLFHELALIQNGMVVRLEFRHGLPCVLEIARDVGPRSGSSK